MSFIAQVMMICSFLIPDYRGPHVPGLEDFVMSSQNLRVDCYHALTKECGAVPYQDDYKVYTCTKTFIDTYLKDTK